MNKQATPLLQWPFLFSLSSNTISISLHFILLLHFSDTPVLLILSLIKNLDVDKLLCSYFWHACINHFRIKSRGFGFWGQTNQARKREQHRETKGQGFHSNVKTAAMDIFKIKGQFGHQYEKLPKTISFINSYW